MNDKNIILTKEQALKLAVDYARIANDNPRCLSVRFAQGLYAFLVETDYMRYEFYVDAAEGDIPGFSAEPLMIPGTDEILRAGRAPSAAA